MYEQPKLNRVGKAEDVILGLIASGDDFDGNYVFCCMEFADEDGTGKPPAAR
jgi:hypothetical protein